MSSVSNTPQVGEIQQLFPGMPISTQEIPGNKEKLNSEQIKALARNEVASVLSFAEVAKVANQIQFNALPKGMTKERAKEIINGWQGWKLLAEGKVSFEFFTEYGHALRRPLEKSDNEHKNKVTVMLKSLSEGNISHRFQRFRADQQAMGKMLPSLPEKGDKDVEEKLTKFISQKGKALLSHLPEDEILKKAYKGGNYNEKAPYESARSLLGGTCGGFLFALQQGMKGGAVSEKFVDDHKEFIQSTLRVTRLMDYNNYLSFGSGKPGLTDTPSPYAYIGELFKNETMLTSKT